VAKKKSYKKVSKKETSHFGTRAALICIGIGTCLIIFCSCLSFDIGDWPSKFVYPQNSPPANWCGTVGAFCAYYLLYYIGPGVFVILISAICYLFARLKHKQMDQLLLRSIGLALTTVAASMSFHYLWPYKFFNFPMGSGGVLGIGAAQFMRHNFASLGTLILVLAIWAVGTILLADNFILFVLHAFDFGFKKITGVAVPAWSATKQSAIIGQGLTDIWQKLSERQKPLIVNPEVPKRPEVAPLKPMNTIPVRTSQHCHNKG